MLSTRSSQVALWLAALTLLSASLVRIVGVASDQLVAPFDLVSEGPHMSAVKAIRAGVNIYDPASVFDLPLHVTPYTPLYHVLVALLPAQPGNPFFTGRVVALVFMVGSAAGLFAVVRRRDYAPLAVLGVALFFLIRAVTANTAFLRCDSMALFFSVWAVIAATRNRAGRNGVVLPALLCVAAIAAKQSYLAAGGACFLHFLQQGWRRAGAFLIAAAAFAAVLALAASIYWGNGFWTCIALPITDYPRDMEGFAVHWRQMVHEPVFLVILVAAAGLFVTALDLAPVTLVWASPYFHYLTLSLIAQSFALTGVGAWTHNLIEPVLAMLLWIAVASQELGGAMRLDWRRAAVLAVIAGCVALELRSADRMEYSFTTMDQSAQYVFERARIARAMGALGLEHGRILNLKSCQAAHDFDGEIVLNDPWMYYMVLLLTRPATAARLVKAIEERSFDAILVPANLVSAEQQPGDNPVQVVFRKAFTYYRIAIRGQRLNVLIPIGSKGTS
ncbi:MAG: hypothetical protein HY271_19125 [Deltaproteobacteria bacterium]|nr:hypothetical protein [Deltaproteobacteria bacterium]